MDMREMCIRDSSCGARRDGIEIGEPVIVNAAVRAGGTASAYLPDIFPAVASLDVVNAMQQAARELGIKSHIGMSLSRDAFYRQNQALNDTLRDVKAVAVSEMECDTVFVVGNALNVRTGAVVGTDSNIYLAKQPTQDVYKRQVPWCSSPSCCCWMSRFPTWTRSSV